jgi:L-alanine-DL-glutamate epimerase-like enolase superfamily enzyme
MGRGFHRFKLHIGTDVAADVRTVAALIDTVGPDGQVYVDVHWRYAPKDALRLGERLAALGAAWLEAPLAPENLAAHAWLAQHLSIPIAVGETLRSAYDFKDVLLAAAADILQPDVGRTGITGLVKIATLAAAWNVPIAPHLSVGLGVMTAATLHAAASI